MFFGAETRKTQQPCVLGSLGACSMDVCVCSTGVPTALCSAFHHVHGMGDNGHAFSTNATRHAPGIWTA